MSRTLLKVTSIIQSNIQYPQHCCIFQALFNIPNFHPKPEHYPVYQALSIIHLSSIKGIIYYPKQHPISTALSPIPKHYSISQIIIQNRNIIQYTKHCPLSNYPASKVLSIHYQKPIQSIIYYSK